MFGYHGVVITLNTLMLIVDTLVLFSEDTLVLFVDTPILFMDTLIWYPVVVCEWYLLDTLACQCCLWIPKYCFWTAKIIWVVSFSDTLVLFSDTQRSPFESLPTLPTHQTHPPRTHFDIWHMFLRYFGSVWHFETPLASAGTDQICSDTSTVEHLMLQLGTN